MSRALSLSLSFSLSLSALEIDWPVSLPPALAASLAAAWPAAPVPPTATDSPAEPTVGGSGDGDDGTSAGRVGGAGEIPGVLPNSAGGVDGALLRTFDLEEVIGFVCI